MTKRAENFLTIALPLALSALMIISPIFLLPAECHLFDFRNYAQLCHTIPPAAGCNQCINEPSQGTAQVLFFLGLGLFFVPLVIRIRRLHSEEAQKEDAISLTK